MFSSRTILIEPKSELRTLIAQNLQVYCDTDVVFRTNADDVNSLLRKDKNYQLIICSSQVGDESTILKIFYYMQSQRLDIPIIGLGENPKVSSRIEMVSNIKDWKVIIKKAASILKIDSKKMVQKQIPDYFPVYTKNLLGLDTAPCFVYLELGGKFELFLDAGDKVDRSMVKKLFLKGVKKVYVEKSWRLSFVNAVSEKVAEDFSKIKSERDHMSVLSRAIENTQELIRLTGINEESVNMANKSMESMRTVAKSSEGLSDLLSILEEDSDSYTYKHCMLTNILANQAIKDMSWGNKIQREKISFICFFHDITIPEDALCEIHSEEALREAKISVEDKKRVRNHAFDAINLLKDYPQVPFGVDSLILQHHGMPNGIGFAKGQNLGISPIAITFRVCEEFVSFMLNLGKDFHMDVAIEKLLDKYDKKQYREVVRSLEKMRM